MAEIDLNAEIDRLRAEIEALRRRAEAAEAAAEAKKKITVQAAVCYQAESQPWAKA